MAEKGVNLPTPCATIKSYTKIIRPPFPPILPQSLCHSLEMPAHSHLSMTFIRSPGIVQGIHRGFKLAFTLTIYPHLTFWPALSSSPGPSTSLSRWVEVALLSDWCRFAWPMMPENIQCMKSSHTQGLRRILISEENKIHLLWIELGEWQTGQISLG